MIKLFSLIFVFRERIVCTTPSGYASLRAAWRRNETGSETCVTLFISMNCESLASDKLSPIHSASTHTNCLIDLLNIATAAGAGCRLEQCCFRRGAYCKGSCFAVNAFLKVFQKAFQPIFPTFAPPVISPRHALTDHLPPTQNVKRVDFKSFTVRGAVCAPTQ